MSLTVQQNNKKPATFPCGFYYLITTLLPKGHESRHMWGKKLQLSSSKSIRFSVCFKFSTDIVFPAFSLLRLSATVQNPLPVSGLSAAVSPNTDIKINTS